MTGYARYVYKISVEKTSAQHKMMDLLARREHSELEIRQKLADNYTPAEIDKAVELAKQKRWLPDTNEALMALAEKTAADLRRRGKGPLYIDQYLEEKGLPPVVRDSIEELEKARALVKNKFSVPSTPEKIGRFLTSRGFDEDIVRKVVYGKNECHE